MYERGQWEQGVKAYGEDLPLPLDIVLTHTRSWRKHAPEIVQLRWNLPKAGQAMSKKRVIKTPFSVNVIILHRRGMCGCTRFMVQKPFMFTFL